MSSLAEQLQREIPATSHCRETLQRLLKLRIVGVTILSLNGPNVEHRALLPLAFRLIVNIIFYIVKTLRGGKCGLTSFSTGKISRPKGGWEFKAELVQLLICDHQKKKKLAQLQINRLHCCLNSSGGIGFHPLLMILHPTSTWHTNLLDTPLPPQQACHSLDQTLLSRSSMLKASVFLGGGWVRKQQNKNTHTPASSQWMPSLHAKQLRGGPDVRSSHCASAPAFPRPSNLRFLSQTPGYARQIWARPHLSLAVKWRDGAKGNWWPPAGGTTRTRLPFINPYLTVRWDE